MGRFIEGKTLAEYVKESLFVTHEIFRNWKVNINEAKGNQN